MALTCPRCGDSFESAAVTATRCPSCRTVVHIARSGAGTSAPRTLSGTSYANGGAVRSDTSDLLVMVGAAAVVACVWAWWAKKGRSWWKRRTGRTEPTTGTPVVSAATLGSDGTMCPRCLTGTARCQLHDCPMP